MPAQLHQQLYPPPAPHPSLDIEHADFEWLRAYLQREEARKHPMPSDGGETSDSNSTVDEGVIRAKKPKYPSPVKEHHGRGLTPMIQAAWSEDSTDASLSVVDPEEYHEGDDADTKRRRKVGWTSTEDLAILATVRRLGTQWPRIAAQLPGRTPDAVRNRWHRLQKTHSLGDTEEGRAALDALLLACGISKDWEPPPDPRGPIVADNSCIKGSDHGRAMWTAHEDALIEEGVRRFGCKWRQIAASLPGRSDSSVRNRWMRLQKEHAAARGDETPTTPPLHTPLSSPPLSPAHSGSLTPLAPVSTSPPFPSAAPSTAPHLPLQPLPNSEPQRQQLLPSLPEVEPVSMLAAPYPAPAVPSVRIPQGVPGHHGMQGLQGSQNPQNPQMPQNPQNPQMPHMPQNPQHLQMPQDAQDVQMQQLQAQLLQMQQLQHALSTGGSLPASTTNGAPPLAQRSGSLPSLKRRVSSLKDHAEMGGGAPLGYGAPMLGFDLSSFVDAVTGAIDETAGNTTPSMQPMQPMQPMQSMPSMPSMQSMPPMQTMPSMPPMPAIPYAHMPADTHADESELHGMFEVCEAPDLRSPSARFNARSTPEPKADSKADSKADPKADPKADSKADAKADPKADPKPDAKADAKADSKAGSKADAKLGPKAEAAAEASTLASASADLGSGLRAGKPAGLALLSGILTGMAAMSIGFSIAMAARAR